MAETIHFELVSPSARLAAVEADAVTVPAAEGDLTAMPMHAPFLSALRPGVVVVSSGGAETRYVVTGGFVEITNEQVGIIAEDAAEADKVDAAWIDSRTEAADKALEDLTVEDERYQPAAQLAADLRQLKEMLSIRGH
ncbi:MAG: ATP synthase F1 subunit epsilon [Pseudomonadota bacterium]